MYGYSGANPSTLEFATGSTTLLTCPTASNPEANRWFHVAVARSGTSLKMFIDGVEVTSPLTPQISQHHHQHHILGRDIVNNIIGMVICKISVCIKE